MALDPGVCLRLGEKLGEDSDQRVCDPIKYLKLGNVQHPPKCREAWKQVNHKNFDIETDR